MEYDYSTEGRVGFLLQLSNLSIGIERPDQILQLTDGVSFDIRAGEIHGLIGESGCGKSISSLAIMGMLPEPGGPSYPGLSDSKKRIYSAWIKKASVHCGEIRYR